MITRKQDEAAIPSASEWSDPSEVMARLFPRLSGSANSVDGDWLFTIHACHGRAWWKISSEKQRRREGAVEPDSRGLKRLTPTARAAAAALLLVLAAGATQAREQKPRPAPAQTAASAPDPTRPARQAESVGLGQCAPILGLMGSQTLTQTYDLQSGWSRTDPTHHVFQSVAALTNPANVPPDGLAALVAAPMAGGGCDGVAIQVFPLAADCPAAQKVMLKTGRLLAPMLNTRIMLDARGNRVILLPGYAHTCIAISVDSRFGTP